MVIRAQGLFCDDVRNEADGRFILIGVYPAVILAEKGENTVVTNWVQVGGLEPGHYKISLRVELVTQKGPTQLGKSRATTVEIDEKRIPIIVTAQNLVIKSEEGGLLRLYADVEGVEEALVTEVVYQVNDAEHSSDEADEEEPYLVDDSIESNPAS